MTYRPFYLIAIFVCLFGSIYSDEIEDSLEYYPPILGPAPIFVSLGSHCEGAVFLRENKLRTQAYPFDWLLSSSHNQFISLLDTDFEFMTDESYFIRHPVHPSVIENSYYEIEFRHDWFFPDTTLSLDRCSEQVEKIQTKYQRRIERFRQLRHCSNKVFFIRVAFEYLNEPNPYWKKEGIEIITATQAIEIKEALHRYFPDLNFTLVIINYQEENAPSISGIDDILEFKIRKAAKLADYANLLNILTTLYFF